jgi:hypothetical protein
MTLAGKTGSNNCPLAWAEVNLACSSLSITVTDRKSSCIDVFHQLRLLRDLHRPILAGSPTRSNPSLHSPECGRWSSFLLWPCCTGPTRCNPALRRRKRREQHVLMKRGGAQSMAGPCKVLTASWWTHSPAPERYPCPPYELMLEHH